MVTALVVPPAGTPERETFRQTVVGSLDRQDGGFYCLECRPIEGQADPCKVFGINIDFYSQTCHGCGALVVDGVKKADGVTPLSLFDPPTVEA